MPDLDVEIREALERLTGPGDNGSVSFEVTYVRDPSVVSLPMRALYTTPPAPRASPRLRCHP